MLITRETDGAPERLDRHAVQALVSNPSQARLQASGPPSKLWLTQFSPPRSAPSQASPVSVRSLPHNVQAPVSKPSHVALQAAPSHGDTRSFGVSC